MRNFRLIAGIWFAAALQGLCAADEISLNIYVTNASGIVNGNALTVIGSTRTATNIIASSPSTLFLATNVLARAKSNLFNHLRLYPFGSGTTLLELRDQGATNFTLIAIPGQTIAFTVTGTWGYGVLATNPVKTGQILELPVEKFSNPTRTNLGDHTVSMINKYTRTNQFDEQARAFSNIVGVSKSQHVRNKVLGDSSTSNTVHGGTLSVVSNGLAHSYISSNTTIKASTLTDTSKLSTVEMREGLDWFKLNGTIRSNYFRVDETGVWLLMTSPTAGVAFTNLTPQNGEMVNWGTMLSLLPLRPQGTTNYWGAYHVFTNIAANIRFWYGFTASNAVCFTPMLHYPTNVGALSSSGTNFTDGTPLVGALLFGYGAKIGGPAGSGSGNAAIGVNASVWIDDFPPAWAVGPNTLVTNFGKFAMGLNGEKATNQGAYSFFGTATENNEFRMGDGGVQSFVRFGPPIKNLNTFTDATNIFGGDISFPQKVVSTIADGHNIVDLGTNVNVRVQNSTATTTWRLGGFRGGNRNGKLVIVDFVTGFPIVVEQESGDTTTLSERISTGYATNFTTAGNCRTWWLYNNTTLRWDLQGMHPPIAASTNSLATTDGNATNLNVWPQTSNSVALRVNQVSNQSNDLISVVSSAGLPMLKVNAYGSLVQSNVTGNSLAVWNTNKQLTNIVSGAIWSTVSFDGTNAGFGDDGAFGVLGRRQTGLVQARGTTSFTGNGDFVTVVGAGTASLADANNPTYLNLVTTAATTGTDLGWSGGDTLMNHFGHSLRAHVWVRMVETNAVRYWFGFTSATAATMAGADDPAGDYAGFRFSDAVPENTFKCVTKDGTTQGSTDSAIAVTATDDFMLSIVWTAGVSAKFYVNGALVATRTTTLPRTSVACRLIAYGETRENVLKNLRIAHGYWEDVRP